MPTETIPCKHCGGSGCSYPDLPDYPPLRPMHRKLGKHSKVYATYNENCAHCDGTGRGEVYDCVIHGLQDGPECPRC